MEMRLQIDNGEPIVFYREDLETLIDLVSGHHEMPQKARDFVLTDLVIALTNAEDESDTSAPEHG